MEPSLSYRGGWSTGAVRRWVEGGFSAAVLVDLPETESLRGAGLQGTLLRLAERIEWMCGWEGALYVEWRSSGRICPVCGEQGVEVSRRKYRCPECGAEWSRDAASCFNAVKSFLEHYLRRGDLAERSRKWLSEKAEKSEESLRKL